MCSNPNVSAVKNGLCFQLLIWVQTRHATVQLAWPQENTTGWGWPYMPPAFHTKYVFYGCACLVCVSVSKAAAMSLRGGKGTINKVYEAYQEMHVEMFYIFTNEKIMSNNATKMWLTYFTQAEVPSWLIKLAWTTLLLKHITIHLIITVWHTPLVLIKLPTQSMVEHQNKLVNSLVQWCSFVRCLRCSDGPVDVVVGASVSGCVQQSTSHHPLLVFLK